MEIERKERSDGARVMVIGGGITGLAAAYRLTERSRIENFPLEILLIESNDRLGGVIATFHQDGFLLEAASDSFITEKPWALDLCQRLGLTDELIETNPKARRSFVVCHDRLASIPEGFLLLAPSRIWPFLSSSFLSPLGKVRMALEWVLPRRKNFQDESVASFVRRRFGHEALHRIAQPMVNGIYVGDPETLSMHACLPRFLEMEKQHGSIIKAIRSKQRTSQKDEGASGPRYGLFLSFRKGMQTLIDRLAESLPQEAIRLKTRVVQIRPVAESLGWRVQFAGQKDVQVDAVCLALPACHAAVLLQGVDAGLSNQLKRIPYTSSVTINLAYRRSDIPHPLNGFGFVIPAIEQHPMVGCSFSSIKFPERAPEGKVLLCAFLSGNGDSAIEKLSDKELQSKVYHSLGQLLGITAPPLFVVTTHSPQSMPQYQVGHLERVRKIEEAVHSYPGLSLAGNAYYGIGVPDCIHSGELAADRLFTELKKCHEKSTGF